LKLKNSYSKAEFSAALNTELSDGWVLSKSNGNFDQSTRGVHTHHIALVDATVTRTARGFLSQWLCPRLSID
jgi:hypothetical protein